MEPTPFCHNCNCSLQHSSVQCSLHYGRPHVWSSLEPSEVATVTIPLYGRMDLGKEGSIFKVPLEVAEPDLDLVCPTPRSACLASITFISLPVTRKASLLWFSTWSVQKKNVCISIMTLFCSFVLYSVARTCGPLFFSEQCSSWFRIRSLSYSLGIYVFIYLYLTML